MSDSNKKVKTEASSFVSPHTDSLEISWDQERKLRLSCEPRHLRFRHVDDLIMVIQKICDSDTTGEALKCVQSQLAAFSNRDNVDSGRLDAVSTKEEKIYVARLSENIKDLRSRYPGDLAQIIEALVRELHTNDVVSKELQRINVAQSATRKKLR